MVNNCKMINNQNQWVLVTFYLSICDLRSVDLSMIRSYYVLLITYYISKHVFLFLLSLMNSQMSSKLLKEVSKKHKNSSRSNVQ